MLKIDDFHITRLDPILDFPRKRQHMHDARVGLARVRSVGRSTEQLLAFCYVRRCGARSTCPRYLESLLLSYPVLLISSFGVSVCCTGLDCRMSHRIWNRGSNGLPKLVQPYAPSILFPVRHPAIGPGTEHADGWAGLGLNRNAGLAARPGEVRRRQPSSSKRNLNLVHLRMAPPPCPPSSGTSTKDT